MHQRKSKKLIIYFFLLIIISSINNSDINNFKLDKINNIHITGLGRENNNILFKEIKNLNLENIFFMNKNKIIKLMESNSLIEKYEVYKRYPSTIYINIEKTNFFAKINDNGKTFLIGSNGKLTHTEKSFNDLPFIFGKPNIEEFLRFKKIIDLSNFSYNEIENLYFFPSKRWDIKLKENILLKLPNSLNNETLNLIYEFLENYSDKKFTVLDYRIENQIILNE